jgi:phenylalanyl-tRNA synthetase beta subunit
MFNLVESGVVLRSVGYALEFRSTSRTLTDNEVNKAIEKVMQALKDELKVVIRDK